IKRKITIALITNEEINIFNSLGLSYCQAKIYLTLANSEGLTVKAIANATKMAREQTYNIMPKLVQQGLVEKIIENPIKYKAIPINECVSKLMDDRKRKTLELETKTKELLKNFSKRKMDQISDVPQFVLLGSKERVLQKIKNLSENNMGNVEELKKNPNFKIRFLRVPFKSILAIKDNCDAILITSASSSIDDTPGLCSVNSAFIEIARIYFENMWYNSIEV
ncbi:hypothetical protein AC477_01925, partial [miscellaneous Crenarchaeota group-1 archaeon SG8-32-1]